MTRHTHVDDKILIDSSSGRGKAVLLPDLNGLAWSDRNVLVEQIEKLNDSMTKIEVKAGRRYGVLPFPYIEESMSELSRVIDVLKVDGVCVVPVAGGRFLDEDDFIPLLKVLDGRRVSLLLHPADTSEVPLINETYLDGVLAMSRLFYFDRIGMMSNVKISIAHSEGVLDFLADNIGMLYYLQKKRMRLGKFMIDFLIKKQLQGESYVRSLEVCS